MTVIDKFNDQRASEASKLSHTAKKNVNTRMHYVQ